MVPEIFASLCAVPSRETAYGVSWTTGSGVEAIQMIDSVRGNKKVALFFKMTINKTLAKK